MIRLHHVNICTEDLPELADFYQNALGLNEIEEFNSARRLDDYNGGVVALDAGDRELLHLHLCEADHDLGFRTGQAVNPLTKGHYAFRTDDLAGVKRRLDLHGVKYSDFGAWAVKGWDQIFFHDPAGTVVEVHQIIGDADATNAGSNTEASGS